MEPSKLANAPSCAGKSLLELLREEMDTVIDRLMSDDRPDPDVEPDALSPSMWLEYGEERGQAQGLAYAIAVIENPYQVDVPRVKDEAMERWEERNEED